MPKKESLNDNEILKVENLLKLISEYRDSFVEGPVYQTLKGITDVLEQSPKPYQRSKILGDLEYGITQLSILDIELFVNRKTILKELNKVKKQLSQGFVLKEAKDRVVNTFNKIPSLVKVKQRSVGAQTPQTPPLIISLELSMVPPPVDGIPLGYDDVTGMQRELEDQFRVDPDSMLFPPGSDLRDLKVTLDDVGGIVKPREEFTPPYRPVGQNSLPGRNSQPRIPAPMHQVPGDKLPSRNNSIFPQDQHDCPATQERHFPVLPSSEPRGRTTPIYSDLASSSVASNFLTPYLQRQKQQSTSYNKIIDDNLIKELYNKETKKCAKFKKNFDHDQQKYQGKYSTGLNSQVHRFKQSAANLYSDLKTSKLNNSGDKTSFDLSNKKGCKVEVSLERAHDTRNARLTIQSQGGKGNFIDLMLSIAMETNKRLDRKANMKIYIDERCGDSNYTHQLIELLAKSIALGLNIELLPPQNSSISPSSLYCSTIEYVKNAAQAIAPKIDSSLQSAPPSRR